MVMTDVNGMILLRLACSLDQGRGDVDIDWTIGTTFRIALGPPFRPSLAFGPLLILAPPAAVIYFMIGMVRGQSPA